MCGGKDQAKPHLHYPAHLRFVADRLMMLSGVQQSDTLEISATIGMIAMLDEVIDHMSGHMVDGMKLAKLLSTRALLEQEYQKRREGFLDKVELIDIAFLDRKQ